VFCVSVFVNSKIKRLGKAEESKGRKRGVGGRIGKRREKEGKEEAKDGKGGTARNARKRDTTRTLVPHACRKGRSRVQPAESASWSTTVCVRLLVWLVRFIEGTHKSTAG
jgi:hypothetical protein